jgi:hypothetical protein
MIRVVFAHTPRRCHQLFDIAEKYGVGFTGGSNGRHLEPGQYELRGDGPNEGQLAEELRKLRYVVKVEVT